MPRKRVKSKRREKKNVVPAWQWHYLCFGEIPEDTEGADRLSVYFFRSNIISGDPFPRTPAEAWGVCRDELLRQWIKERPGTRPWAWWHFDAPRWVAPQFEGTWYQGKLPEPRRQLGGPETSEFVSLTAALCYEFGMPRPWMDAQEKNTTTKYNKGCLKELHVSPYGPPTHETEASYLKRHGLLTEEEKQLDLDYTG